MGAQGNICEVEEYFNRELVRISSGDNVRPWSEVKQVELYSSRKRSID